MMKKRFNYIMTGIENFFLEVGSLVIFLGKIFRQFFRKPYEHKELLKQAYYAGNKTLPLIAVTGFIMGLVLTLQSRPILVDFGAESLLPGMTSISIIREIGPVITALLCAGKISSGYGAEIGSMKVTEQIDAMEVSGTNPMNYLVATRVLATTVMVPLLVFIADAVSLFGAFVAANMHSDITLRLFFSRAYADLDFKDIIPATVKSVFFGFFIGLIGCFKGYYTRQGTEAVGVAANSAVVAASLAIFIIDLLAVQISELIY
jgi:phospholipid/cholesterol/gamma-HCH transport system permease protein